jgi:hypothetical protein
VSESGLCLKVDCVGLTSAGVAGRTMWYLNNRMSGRNVECLSEYASRSEEAEEKGRYSSHGNGTGLHYDLEGVVQPRL